MTEASINFRLSTKASEISERIFMETEAFEDRVSVAKFAFAYAIKNFREDIDPMEIDASRDAQGFNYNIGSIDSDRFIANLITALYPDIDAPYKAARGFTLYGLEKLGDLLEEGKLRSISELM